MEWMAGLNLQKGEPLNELVVELQQHAWTHVCGQCFYDLTLVGGVGELKVCVGIGNHGALGRAGELRILCKVAWDVCWGCMDHGGLGWTGDIFVVSRA